MCVLRLFYIPSDAEYRYNNRGKQNLKHPGRQVSERGRNMDKLFQNDSQEEMFGFDSAAFPAHQSDLVSYSERDRPMEEFRMKRSNHRNINRRMIEFLRRNRRPVMESTKPERERCFRHMINERLRREKQKQSYLALHSVLPPGTKSDKNSIIQMAVKEVEDLQRQKEELERRNNEIEAILGGREEGEEVGGDKIRLKVANPSSGIHSMVEVLKCLKTMGSKTTAIQSKFSSHELSAVLQVQSQSGTAEVVEKAVHRTLFEVERKFRFDFPEY